MKLLHSIAIPDYPIVYNQSNKQRATYYKCKIEDLSSYLKNIPKKYGSSAYRMIAENSFYYLFDTTTNTKVIKNKLKVGTPRIKPIMGQDLFNLQAQAHNHTKIINVIKIWFLSHWDIEDYWDVVKQSNKDYGSKPYSFRFIYRSPNPIDTDNHRIYYEKAIIDSLKIFTYSRKTNKDKLEKVPNPVGFLLDDDSRYLRRLTSEWEEYETR